MDDSRSPFFTLITDVKRLIRKVLPGFETRVSAGYKLNPENPGTLKGWTDAGVAERQHAAFAPLIHRALQGEPRLDFRVAADAIAACGERNPLVLEIGCGSGYYSRVLPELLGDSIRYIGLDYSIPMTELAKKVSPQSDIVAGNAIALPIATGSCDICVSGTSLMHITGYRQAIMEMVRVSRRWCVFHTVPVMVHRPTTTMSKLAYGASVAEIIFNRAEIESLFVDSKLRIRETMESLPYDLQHVVGEHTMTFTYLCEKTE